MDLGKKQNELGKIVLEVKSYMEELKIVEGIDEKEYLNYYSNVDKIIDNVMKLTEIYSDYFKNQRIIEMLDEKEKYGEIPKYKKVIDELKGKTERLEKLILEEKKCVENKFEQFQVKILARSISLN
ncbi:hypothetical protein HOD29_01915 [archaeon]|jgi:hypothetical protein|nr:hypothetical protein [archaeon]